MSSGSEPRPGDGTEQPKAGGRVPPAREDYFLAMVAHELRNPLTPLHLHLQLLRRRLGDTVETPGIGRALEAIERNLTRLEQRLDQIQSAAHVYSGTFAVQPKPCDLAALARLAIDEQVKTDLGQVHRLTIDGPEELPGVWDADRLHQALTNLIGNALKYSPTESEVRVTLEQSNDEVLVTVTDHGSGFAEADQADLFEPYSDLYGRTRIKGLGLGLFLVRGIVEAHGGRVWAESAGPGLGSRFGFALPLTPSETATRTSSPATDSPAFSAGRAESEQSG